MLLLTAFTFITLDARGGEGSLLDRVRESTSSVFGPIERAAAAVVNPVADFIDGVTSINSNADKIDALEAENDELRRQLLTAPLDQARVDELDKLLHVSSLGDYEIVPAQVIAVVGRRTGMPARSPSTRARVTASGVTDRAERRWTGRTGHRGRAGHRHDPAAHRPRVHGRVLAWPSPARRASLTGNGADPLPWSSTTARPSCR